MTYAQLLTRSIDHNCDPTPILNEPSLLQPTHDIKRSRRTSLRNHQNVIPTHSPSSNCNKAILCNRISLGSKDRLLPRHPPRPLYLHLGHHSRGSFFRHDKSALLRQRQSSSSQLSRNTVVMRWRKPSKESRRRGSLEGVNFVGSMVKRILGRGQEWKIERLCLN
jgi:hypothetical protein